ncbi:MAG TPA: GAF and ANTAR domain-containing protein [Geodermatophilus sp.]|nr:GAF and ANTAR domain-containing protein [Geodermatophilus sp.]
MTDSPFPPDLDGEQTAGLSATLARMRGTLMSEETLGSALRLVTALALETIPTGTGSGVTLLGEQGQRTTAATDPLVEQADDAQYELDEGPCLSAARDQQLYRIDSMWQETRWPQWTAIAAALGLGSSLSAPLAVQQESLGAIKVYSGQECAFAQRDERLLTLFAGQAAILLANVASHADTQRLNDHLRAALRSRDLIGQAKGILRERHRIDDDGAFAMLSAESQRTNVKLRDVAQRIVDSIPLNPDMSGPAPG